MGRGGGDRGWADLSLSAKGRIVLALPLSMLLVAVAVLLVSVSQSRASQRSVAHIREVTTQLGVVYNLALEGGAGIRGYLASGERDFLQAADRAREKLPGAADALAALVADDAAQADRARRLRAELDRGHHWNGPGLPSADAPQDELTAWLARQKASTDTIRRLFGEMYVAQDSELAARAADRDAWARTSQLVAGGALVLGLAGGLVAMHGFTVGIARRLERVRGDADLVLAGADPPPQPDPGQDEIGVLSRRIAEVASSWRASEAAARDANQAKSEFLSRMSHELRTPLNAVLGFAQLIEMDAPPGEQESARQIRRAGRHLLDLINEVLDISRIESGQLSLSPETVHVTELIEEAVALMAPIAAARRVAVRLTTPDCLCHAHADRQRVKQVVLNLLSNAVKYNQTDGEVRVRCVQPDAATVLVEVADTGIGIPSGDLPRLFVPFERLSAAGGEIEGTGVGLALSQRLVQLMGGRIAVESEVGRGSTFRVTLPAVDPPQETTLPMPGLAGPRRPVESVDGRTVLSIEDNQANSRLLEQIVGRAPGWRIVHAGLGRLGLDLAAGSPPDLVLLDLHLPDMEGTEVLRRLKAGARTAGVPVVMLTADATPGQVERLRRLGAADYLTKPVDVEAVLDLLDRTARPHPADRR